MSDEKKYCPPCREAARYKVVCPKCGKSMQVGHLKYKHHCSVKKDATSKADQMYAEAVAALENRSKQ